MSVAIPDLQVRLASAGDAAILCEILNEIIRIGGTTAAQKQLTENEFFESFLAGHRHICCHVAVGCDGVIAGFQSLKKHSKLADDWADVATYARVAPKIPGVGTSLFVASRRFAVRSGLTAINATIRADNVAGLAYYEKMGFDTYLVDESVPLDDGTRVDRISKRHICS